MDDVLLIGTKYFKIFPLLKFVFLYFIQNPLYKDLLVDVNQFSPKRMTQKMTMTTREQLQYSPKQMNNVLG